MTEDQKVARRRWCGNLNQIPLSIAEGFRSSPSRINAAKTELTARGIS